MKTIRESLYESIKPMSMQAGSPKSIEQITRWYFSMIIKEFEDLKKEAPELSSLLDKRILKVKAEAYDES